MSVRPQYFGGQCPTTYVITIIVRFYQSNTWRVSAPTQNILGPVQRVRVITEGGTQRTQALNGSGSWLNILSASPSTGMQIMQVILRRQDNQPDTCGDAPLPEEPFPDTDVPPLPPGVIYPCPAPPPCIQLCPPPNECWSPQEVAAVRERIERLEKLL